MKNNFFILGFIILLLFAVVPSMSFGEQWAATIGFECDDNGSCNSSNDKLNVVINTLGSNGYDLRFTFTNTWQPNKDYSIQQISLTGANILDFSNYHMAQPTEEVDFSPDVGTTSSEFISFSSSSESMGIGPGDSLSFKFNFTNDPMYEIKDIFSLVGAIAESSLSIGLSVALIGSESIAYNYSSSSVEGPYAVPEPATMLLLGSGLIGVAGLARRRNRKCS